MNRLVDWLWERVFGVTRWDHLTVDDALLDRPDSNKKEETR